MKHTIKISIVILTSIFVSSCNKGYLDVNEVNPNQTSSPPIDGLLASVTYQSGLNVYRAGNVTAYYVQHLASPNAASGSDIYDNVDRSTFWYNVYNVVMDGRQMLDLAKETGAYEHKGVAFAMEAMNMSMLIDFFGDAPYSEAWNANILQPKYDKAEDIYNKCLSLVDSAIANFSLANPVKKLSASSDLIHAGNIPAWLKTCHALKARLLNRVSKLSNYNPTQILSELAAAYTSNADDAQITKFVGRSPWNQTAFNNTQLLLDGWMSKYMVDVLNGSVFGIQDPRVKYITELTKFNDYRGTRNGAGRVGTGTNKEESYLSLNGFYSKAGAPLLLATYAEMKFIEAEASFATDKNRSYQAYLAGITANMDKMGVTNAEKLDYLSSPIVAPGVASFTKNHIFKEKHIAQFLHPEAWTDARRNDYNYQGFQMPLNAVLSTFIRRAGYPSTELDRNKANVPEVGSLADKLWWDK